VVPHGLQLLSVDITAPSSKAGLGSALLESSVLARPTQGGTVDPHAFGNREPIYGENGKSGSYERTWWPRSQRLFLIFIALVKK
jgi:hypothetical protein